VSTSPNPRTPDAEWLPQLSDERRRLERVVAELAAANLDEQRADEDVGEVAGASQHPADVATETLEREVELGLMEEFREALAEVEHAEARLADGTYGRCERCQQPIAAARLRAVPSTRWCVRCAEAVEHDARWAVPRPPASIGALGSGEFLALDDELEEAPTEQSGEEAAISISPFA
jgi:RNA polymerase-binding transcription factor DksA